MAKTRNLYLKIFNHSDHTFSAVPRLDTGVIEAGPLMAPLPPRPASGDPTVAVFWMRGTGVAGSGPVGQVVLSDLIDATGNITITFDIPFGTDTNHVFTAIKDNGDAVRYIDNIAPEGNTFSSTNYDHDYDARRITAHVHIGLPPVVPTVCKILLVCPDGVDPADMQRYANDLQIPFANRAMANALVPMSFECVDAKALSGPSETTADSALSVMKTNAEVAGWMAQSGADVGVYLALTLVGNSGKADDIPGLGDAPADPYITVERSAWMGGDAMDWIFAHEVAHLMGAQHLNLTTGTNPSVYKGYDFTHDGDDYRTIMSKSFDKELVPQFSAADVQCKMPYNTTGSVLLIGDDTHNAAAILRENYTFISS